MRMGWRSATVGLGLLAALVAGTVRPDPAAAACVQFDVWVTWAAGGSSPVTPWPQGHCIQSTPWPELAHPSGGDHEGWVPPPLPNGVFFDGSVPSP